VKVLKAGGTVLLKWILNSIGGLRLATCNLQ
jgi:hypothetical protein